MSVSPPSDGATDPTAVPTIQVGCALEGVQVTQVRDGALRLQLCVLVGDQLGVEQVQERDVGGAGGNVIRLDG